MKQSGSIIRQAIFRTVLLLLVLWGQVAEAVAGENDRLPQLAADQVGSLSVHVFYKKKDGTKIRIEGMRLQVLQIADLTVQADGTAEYTLIPEFQGSGVSFENMTAAHSLRDAKMLQALVQEKHLAGQEEKTDEDGMAYFGDLKPGMYLIWQMSEKSESAFSVKMDPYLVSVPQTGQEAGKVIWDYEVTMQPKTGMAQKPTMEKTTEKPHGSGLGSGSVRTGDVTPVEWYALGGCAAGFLLLSLILSRRGRNEYLL